MIYMDSTFLRLLSLYRPPPSKTNGLKISTFNEEFANFIQGFTLSGGELLLLGDFNIHVNDPNDTNARYFTDLIQSANLKQHVTVQTHKNGNTLDLILTRDENPLVKNIIANDCAPSDHFPVKFSINTAKPSRPMKTIKYRKWKEIDIDALKEDITKSSLLCNPCNSLEDLVKQYNSDLSTILDSHAPEIEKRVVIHPDSSRYTEDIRKEKQKRRQLERHWRQSKSENQEIN